jgi:hypothetical protein
MIERGESKGKLFSQEGSRNGAAVAAHAQKLKLHAVDVVGKGLDRSVAVNGVENPGMGAAESPTASAFNRLKYLTGAVLLRDK